MDCLFRFFHRRIPTMSDKNVSCACTTQRLRFRLFNIRSRTEGSNWILVTCLLPSCHLPLATWLLLLRAGAPDRALLVSGRGAFGLDRGSQWAPGKLSSGNLVIPAKAGIGGSALASGEKGLRP